MFEGKLISSHHNTDGFGPHVRGLMHVYCVQLESRALSSRLYPVSLFSLPSSSLLFRSHSASSILRFLRVRKHSIGHFRFILEFVD